MTELADYIRFCKTDRQKEIFNAIREYGSQRKAAAALGISKSTISEIVSKVKKYAETSGFSPEHDMTKTVPEGFAIKGVSTLYDSEGNLVQQWVKSSAQDEKRHQALIEAIQEIGKTIPKSEVFSLPRTEESDLCTLITITDYHLGMFADRDESGVEWNSAKAYSELNSISERIAAKTDFSDTIILNIMGDFLHTDSVVPVTPSHHHVLDADVRYHTMIRLAVSSIKYMVKTLKPKCNYLILTISEGNHDISSSKWLQILFESYYSDDPNIRVMVNSTPFTNIVHGETMIMLHHGHKLNVDQIAASAASLFPKDWGNTNYRYAHVGHRHHRIVKENHGIIVEQHQTYAPKDAYSANHGYIAERGINVITYSSMFGEISRFTIRPK